MYLLKKSDEDIDLIDILSELVNMGLGKAANVISELTECYVNLGLVKLYYTESLKDIAIYSNYIVVQDVNGNLVNGKSIFSMLDDELLKLLRHIEVIEDSDQSLDADNFDLILDSYQEIGNIILGNISCSIIDFLDESSELKPPFVAPKSLLDNLPSTGFIIIDVLFKIDDLNCSGKLCLIFDYISTENIAKKIRSED